VLIILSSKVRLVQTVQHWWCFVFCGTVAKVRKKEVL